MLRDTFVAVFAGADDDEDGAPLTEEQKQERALRAMREAATGAFGGAPMGPRSS